MRRFLLVVTVVVVLTSLAAVAQEFPRAQAFFGYSYARNQIEGSTAYNFNGWNGEATVNANRFFGITASISGQYHQVPKGGPDLSFYHFLFGPQFTYRSADSKVMPFGRFLFGATRVNAKDATENTTQTEWSYGFGGGMDVKITNHVAARVFQADYIRTHILNDHQQDVRLSFGLTFLVGGGK